MKRTLAVVAVGVLVLGGGAAAFAATTAGGGGGGGDNSAKRAQVKDCMQKFRQANPNADPAARKAARQDCLKQAGVNLQALGRLKRFAQNLTQDQKDKLRQCVVDARKAAGKGAVLSADQITKCLQTAGVTLNADQQARLTKLQECRAQVRKDNPDAKGPQLRQLVRQCVGAK